MGRGFGKLSLVQLGILEKAFYALDQQEKKFAWGILRGLKPGPAAVNAGYCAATGHLLLRRENVAAAVAAGQAIQDAASVSSVLERKATLTEIHRGRVETVAGQVKDVRPVDRIQAIDRLNAMERIGQPEASGLGAAGITLILDYHRSRPPEARLIDPVAVEVGPAIPPHTETAPPPEIVDPGAKEPDIEW